VGPPLGNSKLRSSSVGQPMTISVFPNEITVFALGNFRRAGSG